MNNLNGHAFDQKAGNDGGEKHLINESAGNSPKNIKNNDDNLSSRLASLQRSPADRREEISAYASSDQMRRSAYNRTNADMTKIQQICNEYALTLNIDNTQRTTTRLDGSTFHEKGAEVFIGKLPRDVFEDELLPLVKQWGEIVEFRIMLDYNGFNRGYAFVTYQTRAEASKALKALNNYEIKQGKLLGVCRSVDNCRLFVGGIPKTKKKDEIQDEMQKVTEGVVDVIVYPSAADKTKNRGFAFVEYESHKSAAMARRKLLPGKIQLWNQPIAVDWAEPEVDVDDEIMAQVKILYIRNLMLNTREETLENIFRNITGNATIERVKKIRDYAFVHFNTRENAALAMKKVNGMEIDGSRVEVTWAKPVDREAYAKYNKNAQRQFLGQQTFARHYVPLTADQLSGLTTTSNIYGIPASIPVEPAGSQQQAVPVTQQAIPLILGPNTRNAPPVLLTPGASLQARHMSRGGGHVQRPHGNHHHNGNHYNNGYQFQRQKPRGAGGVRAVGSRQYLGNRMNQDGRNFSNYNGQEMQMNQMPPQHIHPQQFVHAPYVISQADLGAGLQQDGLSAIHQPLILAPAALSHSAVAQGAAAEQRSGSGDHVGAGQASTLSSGPQQVVHSIVPTQIVYNTQQRQVGADHRAAQAQPLVTAAPAVVNPIGTVVNTSGRGNAGNQIVYMPTTFLSQDNHEIYGAGLAGGLAGATAIQQAQNAGNFNRAAGTAASTAGTNPLSGPSYMVYNTAPQAPVGSGLSQTIDSQVMSGGATAIANADPINLKDSSKW